MPTIFHDVRIHKIHACTNSVYQAFPLLAEGLGTRLGVCVHITHFRGLFALPITPPSLLTPLSSLPHLSPLHPSSLPHPSLTPSLLTSPSLTPPPLTPPGISLHTFHGNFFVRSTDLLSLPNTNPDHGYTISLSIDENLKDNSNICCQAALLYTSCRGNAYSASCSVGGVLA